MCSSFLSSGDVNRQPCAISPYHYRLDWLLWFAAFQSYQECPWIVHLAVKLLDGDPGARSLIAVDPFYGAISSDVDSQPPGDNSESRSKGEDAARRLPRAIRAVIYRYAYAPLSPAPAMTSEADPPAQAAYEDEGLWWRRERAGEYFPPLEKGNPSVHAFLEAHGWATRG